MPAEKVRASSGAEKKAQKPVMMKKHFWRLLLEYAGLARTAVDIGSDSVRSLTAVRLGPVVIPLDANETAVKAGNIAAALQKVLDERPSSPDIDLSFSGSQLTPLCISLPKMPRDRMESVVRTEIENLIPLPPDGVATFTKEIRAGDFSSSRSVTLAYCLKKDLLKSVLDAVASRDRTVNRIHCLPLRSAVGSGKKYPSGRTGVFSVDRNRLILAVLRNGLLEHFTQSSVNTSRWNAVSLKSAAGYFSKTAGPSGLDRLVVRNATGQALPGPVIRQIRESAGPSAEFIVTDVKEKSLPLAGLFRSLGAETSLRMPSSLKSRLPFIVTRSLVQVITALNLAVLAWIPVGLSDYWSGLPGRRAVLEQKPDTAQNGQYSRAVLLHRLLTRVSELENQIAKSGGARLFTTRRSDLLHKIAAGIPRSVTLDRLILRDMRAEMEGTAGDISELEKWVNALADEPDYRNVNLDRADMIPSENGRTIQFHVRWETGR